jgi:hypothetical protein
MWGRGGVISKGNLNSSSSINNFMDLYLTCSTPTVNFTNVEDYYILRRYAV